MKKYLDKTNIILMALLFLTVILFLAAYIFKFSVPVESGITDELGRQIELKENDKFEVYFISKVDNLEDVKIQIKELVGELKRDNIYVSIYDHNNKLIYYNDLADSKYFDNIYYSFKFKKVQKSFNKSFKLTLDVKNKSDKYKLKLSLFNSKNKYIHSKYNNKKVNGIPVVEYGYTVTFFYKGLATVLSIILLFIFFRHNFKDNVKLKEKLLNKKVVFIIEFIFSVIASFSFLKFIYIMHYLSKSSIVYYSSFIFSIVIVLFILSLYLGDKDLKREDLFLLISIPITVMYLMFVLPLKVPDELYHYKIAYRLSEFKFFTFTSLVPKIYINQISNYNDLFNLCSKNISFISVESGTYHPLLYIFSSIGILISKIIGLSPVIGMYMGSMFNLIVYLLIGYIVVKKIPFGKFLMIVYLLNPMFIHQATSFSVDAMINIFSMLFISYVLYIKYEKKKIETKDFISLVVGLVFVIVGKYAYFMLALLLILIRKELKEYVKNHKKVFIICFSIFLLIAGSWLIYTKLLPKFTSVDSVKAHSITYKKVQNSESKMSHLINNPTNIVPIYIRTITNMTSFYIVTFFGSSLGSLDIHINTAWIIIYISILIISILLDKNKYESDKKNNILNIIVFVVTFNIVLGGLYFGWGVITDTYINGVQGRYFIPVIILLLLPLIKKKNYLQYNNLLYIILLVLIINHILIVKDIIIYFLS